MATNSPVSFKIITAERFKMDGEQSTWVPAYRQGQIIFVEDNNESKIWLDFHGQRTCYSGFGSGGASNGINYVGISSTDPLGGIVTVNGVVYSPSKNDMVVYDTKEYLYRDDGQGNLGWFELGDETKNDLVWQED